MSVNDDKLNTNTPKTFSGDWIPEVDLNGLTEKQKLVAQQMLLEESDCLVWYGMVRYGMVWYGMVWYGMVWYGMVWYGMVWYGMVKLYLMTLAPTEIS